MGIPAFYRWLSEKYPKVVQDILEQQQNIDFSVGSSNENGGLTEIDLAATNPNGIEFDNLYIDMNGLIHPCSHPEDRPPPKSELEMFENIVKYVERVFAAVRPRKLLFMAMDGVAPRAKMNQQRSRRFRVAQDIQERQETTDEIRQELIEKGYSLPVEEVKDSWDSNCITPGTQFMDGLSKFVKRYIIQRMSNNVAWSNIRVIFSDSSEPGEGEHKIMSFIRHQRSQVAYDPNQWHVIHGLDADLIMLSLATHEGRFTILREQVLFTGRAPVSSASDLMEALQSAIGGDKEEIKDIIQPNKWIYAKKLQFLHVHVIREYLAFEFEDLRLWAIEKRKQYELERIIDDFVFLCFFVGNDFLPHLPSLDIREGAIDFLLLVYKQLFITTLDGNHLTSPGGIINLSNVGTLLMRVGEIEDEVFKRRENAKQNEKMRSERRGNNSNNRFPRQISTESDSSLPQQINEYPYLESSRSNVVAAVPIVVRSYSAEENKLAAARLKGFCEETEVVVGDKRKHDDDDDDETKKKMRKMIDELPSEFKNVDQCAISKSDVDDEVKKRQIQESNKIVDEFYVKSSGQDPIMYHEQGWKARYYSTKFKDNDAIARNIGHARRAIFVEYIQGLQWIMLYYYSDVPSWKWFYPYHYAPMASDLIDIASFAPIKFQLSRPFRPFEQLLSVLPRYSIDTLPEAYQPLLTSSDSPILDFYPDKSPIDPNGKKMPWQWILLLPFIDEDRLKRAIELFGGSNVLTREEAERNRFGNSRIYVNKQPLCYEFHVEVEAAVIQSSGICDSIQLLEVGPPSSCPHEWDCYDVGMPVDDRKQYMSRCGVFVSGKSEFDTCINNYSDQQTKMDGMSHSGLFGYLRRDEEDVDDVHFEADENNQHVMVGVIKNPPIPQSFTSQCKLLPNITLPDPILTPQDFFQRSPRLSRDVNITDLANKKSFYSMPESTSGMRSWGSSEPSFNGKSDRNYRSSEQDSRYFSNNNNDPRDSHRDNNRYRPHDSRSNQQDERNQQRMDYCYGGSDQASYLPPKRAEPAVSQSFSFKQSVSKMMENTKKGR